MRLERNILRVQIWGCLFTFTNIASAKPDTLWTRTYGGIEHDYGYTVQQTFDSGFIIIGETESYGMGDRNIWLIKTDALGDTIWTKTYGTVYGAGCGAHSGEHHGQQTSDSGYIIAGFTVDAIGNQDLWLLKTNSLGDTVWTKIYDRNCIDDGQAIQQTSDGGYIITGYTYIGGAPHAWLLKTDSLGDTLWTKTFGDTSVTNSAIGLSVQQTLDGGYIITGSKNGNIWLLKTDSFGDTLWTQRYGGTDSDWGNSVQQTSDGGYIITGEKNNLPRRTLLLKTDTLGNEVWMKTYDGWGECGQCVRQTLDGNYIIVGVGDTVRRLLFMKTDSLGDTIWKQVYGGVDEAKGHSVQQTSDGGYIITGSKISFGTGNDDVWLLRIGPDIAGVEEEVLPRKANDSFLLYQNIPNPFTSETIIKYQIPITTYHLQVSLSIYNLAGTLIKTFNLPSNNQSQNNQIVWNGQNNTSKKVANGVYFYKLRAGNYTKTKKMYLIR